MTSQGKTFMASAAALAIASFWPGVTPVVAHDGTPETVEQRLERIEQKLDRILERLEEEGLKTGPVAAGAATIPPAPARETNTDIPPPPGVPDPQPFRPGAVAIARAAPERPNALSDIPADSVGSFVYGGGAIPLNELSRSGVRYTGVAAVELQGWLKVTEPGRTQIGVEYQATTGSNAYISVACIASVWLEDRAIGSERGDIPMPAREQKNISLVMGADLQPGLYRLRVWSACTPPRDVRQLTAELLVKSPTDMNLRAITSGDLLHRGG
ncbi:MULTISPECIES: hypothetical protein [Chelativorans]|jgi:hypothetical protein|uniref:Uncharacterized protein n=1 Tax=Chelativorans sp. (strain BNC1) TaxID=266779 RepID=Q11MZ3_CHESB|nr:MULTISPECIES: hypothetical protein [Chelativorans]